MPAIDLSKITIGGPCKITDSGTVLYTEGDAVLEPNPVYRDVESAIAGADDGTLVDLTWSLKFKPKSIWSSGYRSSLLPSAYTNFSAGGTRIIGAGNRTVTVLGSDGEQYALQRAALTQMPELFLGLGDSLYGDVEYTAFIKNGAQLNDVDAFYVYSTGVAWSQSDFPTRKQCARPHGVLSPAGPTYSRRKDSNSLTSSGLNRSNRATSTLIARLSVTKE